MYLTEKPIIHAYDIKHGKSGKTNTYLSKVVDTVDNLYGWAVMKEMVG